MNKYTIFQVLLAVAMTVNWLIFDTPLSLWTFGLVTGMACSSVFREIMA